MIIVLVNTTLSAGQCNFRNNQMYKMFLMFCAIMQNLLLTLSKFSVTLFVFGRHKQKICHSCCKSVQIKQNRLFRRFVKHLFYTTFIKLAYTTKL